MPLSAYQQALAKLKPGASLAVKRAFAAWSKDATLRQVQQNVAKEAALTADDFTSLLNAFADQLTSGKSPIDSWLTGCGGHKLRGYQLLNTECPAILGRVKGLDHHATSIHKASRGGLTKDEANKLLLKHADSPNPIGFETFLREALLGDSLIWAFFDSANPNRNPFDQFPNSHAAICTSLGLGHVTTADTLIVLVWSHVDSGSPPLHRPTIADAKANPYFRPHADAKIHWGLTKPLPPNPGKLQPQPEVVMPEITSMGLQLPFRVVQA